MTALLNEGIVNKLIPLNLASSLVKAFNLSLHVVYFSLVHLRTLFSKESNKSLRGQLRTSDFQQGIAPFKSFETKN